MYAACKFGTPSIYGPAPEYVVDGFVSLSSFDLLVKTYLVIALLSLHAAYRCWRYPEWAILLEEGINLSRLHANMEDYIPGRHMHTTTAIARTRSDTA